MIDCGTPPSSPYLQITARGGTKYQAIATYTCSQSAGQRCLDGPSTRHCNADGQWSGKQPTCVGLYLHDLLLSVFCSLLIYLLLAILTRNFKILIDFGLSYLSHLAAAFLIRLDVPGMLEQWGNRGQYPLLH